MSEFRAFLPPGPEDVLAVDLDGTVLHEPEAEIAVFGRTEYRYMSAKTARLLAKISRILPVVIATGRNARSAGRLASQLPEVRFAGFVLENGMIARTECVPENTDPATCPVAWEPVRALLQDWDLMPGYEATLALRIPDELPLEPFLQRDPPGKRVRTVLRQTGIPGYYYREGRKIFIYPLPLSKLRGVRELGRRPLISLGDYLNDLDIMEAAPGCGALPGAHEEIRRVIYEKSGRNHAGWITSCCGHKGSEELLEHVFDLLSVPHTDG